MPKNFLTTACLAAIKDKGHVIKDIIVKGEHEIEFQLKRPQATFLKNIAMSPFGIASPAAVEKAVIHLEKTQWAQDHLSLKNGSKTTVLS